MTDRGTDMRENAGKKRFKLFSQKVATWPWQGTPPLAWRWTKPEFGSGGRITMDTIILGVPAYVIFAGGCLAIIGGCIFWLGEILG